MFVKLTKDHRAALGGIFIGAGFFALAGLLMNPIFLIIGGLIAVALFALVLGLAACSRKKAKPSIIASEFLQQKVPAQSHKTELRSALPDPELSKQTPNSADQSVKKIEASGNLSYEPSSHIGLIFQRRAIDSQYDHYAGPNRYPLDWEVRAAEARRRDHNTCQVTGCVRRVNLDVHHKERIGLALAAGRPPDHRLENLVTLCRFHHAMVNGHEGLESDEPDRWRLVQEHRRRSQRRRYFRVSRHVWRSEESRVTKASLEMLINQFQIHYRIKCTKCENTDSWHIEVSNDLNRVLVGCKRCWRAWMYNRGLEEEIGPQLLGTLFKATANRGSFTFDANWLHVRSPAEAKLCERCRATDNCFSPMFRKKKRNGKKFLACERWTRERGCKGLDWDKEYEDRVWLHQNRPASSF